MVTEQDITKAIEKMKVANMMLEEARATLELGFNERISKERDRLLEEYG